jgi:hypothetical protein
MADLRYAAALSWLLCFSAISVGAADLTKIERSITKEPVYQSKARRYCLLVLGEKAKTRIWLVLDGDVLFVDRNGNGDLTEAGKKVRLAEVFKSKNLEDMQDERGSVAVGCGLLRGAVAPPPRPERGQAPAAVIPLRVEQPIDELRLLRLSKDSFQLGGCPETPGSVVQILFREPVFQIGSEPPDPSIAFLIGSRRVVTRQVPTAIAANGAPR